MSKYRIALMNNCDLKVRIETTCLPYKHRNKKIQ